MSAISVAVELQFNLGTCYDMGCGVTLPPDFAKCGGSRREVESAAKMAAVHVCCRNGFIELRRP